MVNNNLIIENKKSFEEVSYINEAVQLPNLSEITDKNGKVKLPAELVNKLRDPNARFEVDLTVCPVGYESWEDLYVACMSSGCNDTTPGYWKHGNCRYSSPSRMTWSTHARLKCPSCYETSDISRWSFHCHGSGCTETTTNIARLTQAVIMAIDYECINKDFAKMFLKNVQEIFNK